MNKADVQEVLRQDLLNAIRSAQHEGDSEVASRLIAIASIIPPAGAVSPWLQPEHHPAPLSARMLRLWEKSARLCSAALKRSEAGKPADRDPLHRR